MLLHAGAYASRAKLIEKIEEHRLSYRAMGPTWNHETDFVQPPRRVRNASRSNIITSCSFLRSAPCNGGIAFLGSRDCSTSNGMRSEEHTSELQSLMRTSYAVFCLKKKNTQDHTYDIHSNLHITYDSILQTHTL